LGGAIGGKFHRVAPFLFQSKTMKSLSEITHEEALKIARLLMGGAFISQTTGWVVRPLGEALDPKRKDDWNGLHVSHPKNDYYLTIDFDDDDIQVNNLEFPDMEKIPLEIAFELFKLLEKMGIQLSWVKN
jgi:hypothetical protein